MHESSSDKITVLLEQPHPESLQNLPRSACEAEHSSQLKGEELGE